jgi:signal recognition particle receptor subunit beta
MAILDPRSDAVVIRVVYDGSPMAGKTTSVRALGRGLGGEVSSPAEVSGRTLYFDWLDYTGGLFEGRRIRCQIISVPGQATLAPRRRRLLEGADAIVFVGDSTPTGFAADRSYLSGLQTVLERLSGPPVGIVFQANKRDHADAVPIGKVRSMLADLGLRVAVVESIATESSGIREAFVFAVRLALDRVRDLMRTGELAAARPEVDSAQELLEDLKRVEDGSMDYAALTGLVHTRLAEIQPDTMLVKALAEAVGSDDDSAGANGISAAPTSAHFGANLEPATPDDRVASGLIWPPVDGRLVLHELAQANVALTRSAEGDWSAVANGRWRMHSAADDVFAELEQGRAILVQAARNQAVAREKTASCCIALAADGHGRHRLWRIERMS